MMSASIIPFPQQATEKRQEERAASEDVLLSALKKRFDAVVVVGTTPEGDLTIIHNAGCDLEDILALARSDEEGA